MARRKASKKQATRPKPKQRRNRAPRKRRSMMTDTNKTTSPIVTATRTIVSLLPGTVQAVVRPLADFIFRGFGLGTGVSGSKDGPYKLEASFTGLANAMVISPCILLAFCDRAIRQESYDIITGAQFSTNIASVKTKSVVAVIRNVAANSGRRGYWAAVFIEYGSQVDHSMWLKRSLGFREIRNIPGSVSGLCCTDLRLNWRPRRDSFAASAVPLGTRIGLLAIGFENLDRSGYAEFSSDDFGCTVALSGQFQIVEWMPNNSAMSMTYSVETQLPSDCVVLSTKESAGDPVVTTVKTYRYDIKSCTASTDGSSCIVQATKRTAMNPSAPPSLPQFTEDFDMVSIY